MYIYVNVLIEAETEVEKEAVVTMVAAGQQQ